MFWCFGVGLMVDGGGVAGSGREGTTTADRLPLIKPSVCTPFLLLSDLRWKHPKKKTKTNISLKVLKVLGFGNSCKIMVLDSETY